MKILLILPISLLFIGCAATWDGVKRDSNEAYEWSKFQVNQGATFVKEKTEPEKQ